MAQSDNHLNTHTHIFTLFSYHRLLYIYSIYVADNNVCVSESSIAKILYTNTHHKSHL